MRVSTVIAVALATIGPARAEVTRFEQFAAEQPAFQARSFGDRGTAEKITARATVAVDPSDLRNASIADITLAPRNAEGLV